MFAVTVRDHVMIAHSFDGEVFGPAQRLHGATYVVDATFRGPDLGPDGILVDIGRAAEELNERAGRAELPQPRRRGRVQGHQHLDRGARQVGGRPARCERSRDEDLLTGLTVTLHESHVAWASYERQLSSPPSPSPPPLRSSGEQLVGDPGTAL